MKVLLDTELSPKKKYGVDAVENIISPANLCWRRWAANILKFGHRKSVESLNVLGKPVLATNEKGNVSDQGNLIKVSCGFDYH